MLAFERGLHRFLPEWVRAESVMLGILQIVLSVVCEHYCTWFGIARNSHLGSVAQASLRLRVLLAIPSLAWWLAGAIVALTVVVKDRYVTFERRRLANLLVLVVDLAVAALVTESVIVPYWIRTG